MIPKFRAWDKRAKEMIEDVTSIHFKTEMIATSDLCFYPFKDIELMQSTGLYDANGKKIFEGDVLQCWYEKGFVVMRQGSWFIETDKEYLGTLYEYLDEATIIGNIYEHSELLE